MHIKSGAWMTGVIVAGALGVSGCATKDYVNKQVSAEDTKVAAEGSTLDQHDARLSAVDASATQAMDRANAAATLAEGKFVYSSVQTDGSITFARRSAQLSPDAQARLTDMAQKLKTDNKNVYVEIQGHTDPGETHANAMELGKARADAVRRFLYQQGVPLTRMSTISYGDTTPASPLKTPDARAQNRRVVVVVMA
jgi:peptidoglycan-associated lipoprotein